MSLDEVESVLSVIAIRVGIMSPHSRIVIREYNESLVNLRAGVGTYQLAVDTEMLLAIMQISGIGV